MQRAAAAGPSGSDEDLADGDLGDGTRTKPKTYSTTQRSQSCTGLSAEGVGLWSPGGAHCSSGGAHWSHTQLREMSRSGSLGDLSKEELINRLQKATETIEVLQGELEVAHRYLEGKYAALKILQGQAILEKATPHTKSVLQKSEERAKALEKEVNTLQWELSLSQLRLRTSEQAFEKNFYRMLSERNSLEETLKQRDLEKEQLQAENLALSQQYVELLSRINQQSIYTGTKGQNHLETDGSAPQVSDHNQSSEANGRPP